MRWESCPCISASLTTQAGNSRQNFSPIVSPCLNPIAKIGEQNSSGGGKVVLRNQPLAAAFHSFAQRQYCHHHGSCAAGGHRILRLRHRDRVLVLPPARR